jgi:hypothetical protein
MGVKGKKSLPIAIAAYGIANREPPQNAEFQVDREAASQGGGRGQFASDRCTHRARIQSDAATATIASARRT